MTTDVSRTLREQELMDGLSDCREIDGMVSGAGDAERRKQLELQMAALVQTIRAAAAQLLSGLQTSAAKRDGYVTFSVWLQGGFGTRLLMRVIILPGSL